MSVADGRFGATLREAIMSWLTSYGALPVVMSGMIGSRQGWHEAPYVSCPARIDDLAATLVTLEHSGLPPVHLVAGVATQDERGNPDVMRGEEMQIFGALTALSLEDAIFVLPGTHSKWATVQAGAIISFRTYMTGEVFAALKGHTILGRLMSGTTAHNPEAFERGVRDGDGHAPGDLLHRIFAARSLALFGSLSEPDVESYLSGLLIGAEIISATLGTNTTDGPPVHILANTELANRYVSACHTLGVPCQTVDGESVVLGHLAIADALGATETN
jgi:2-dehydro-3-deoxygalactonokinase